MAESRENSGEDAGSRRTAVLALFAGALIWGVIWYPYRILRDAGIDGIAATTATYSVAFLLGLAFLRRSLSGFKPGWSLLWLALAAGGCNLGYVLATLSGGVVRVLLLFYLAPLWTVLLSRLLLGERLSRFGAFVIALSLGGAATILWHPALGWPVPKDSVDWLGLFAGFSFALFNVLSRFARDIAIETKSMVSFLGVVIVGALLMLAGVGYPAVPVAPVPLTLVLVVGGILLLANLIVQYGLVRIASNRAIVIMLSEVGFAAVSSWLLAGECFGSREAVGGAMILAASVFSSRMEAPEK